MAEQGGKYFCDVCGLEIEVIKSGTGIIFCCGKQMQKK